MTWFKRAAAVFGVAILAFVAAALMAPPSFHMAASRIATDHPMPQPNAKGHGDAGGPSGFGGFGDLGQPGSNGTPGLFPPGARGTAALLHGPHDGEDRTGILVAAMALRFIEFLIVIAALVWALKAILHSRRVGSPVVSRSAALDELEALYARGEVKRDDFLARRADLV